MLDILKTYLLGGEIEKAEKFKKDLNINDKAFYI